MLSQEHPSVSEVRSDWPATDLQNIGGAGGVEPLSSAFTEPRAFRYTTGRISSEFSRDIQLSVLLTSDF